jgi:hypothetical protein
MNRIPGFSPEVAYSAPDAQDGFATNLNVLPEPGLGQGRPVGQVVEGTVPQLEASGFQEVEQHDPFVVDGKEAGVVTALASQNGVSYRTRQYFLSTDDAGWIVTFSFPQATPGADQAELAESVMTTWTWS